MGLSVGPGGYHAHSHTMTKSLWLTFTNQIPLNLYHMISKILDFIFVMSINIIILYALYRLLSAI